MVYFEGIGEVECVGVDPRAGRPFLQGRLANPFIVLHPSSTNRECDQALPRHDFVDFVGRIISLIIRSESNPDPVLIANYRSEQGLTLLLITLSLPILGAND
jgi:hypothetical protein